MRPPGGSPSWLFGTMHIRDDRVYRFCQTIYPLIQKADVYVGEMDLNPIAVQIDSLRYDIKEFVKPRPYLKLRNQLLKSFDFDLDAYAHLHPLVIISGITHHMLTKDHSVSLEEHLWRYAKENDLSLQGLETVHEQLGLLQSIAPGALYKQIKQIGSRPGKIRKFTNKALSYYVNGDIHLLYQMTKSSMHELRKRIIYQRNVSMAQRISSYDLTRQYFITVGAGHLSGPYGLISLLRKKGWKVTPVISLAEIV